MARQSDKLTSYTHALHAAGALDDEQLDRVLLAVDGTHTDAELQRKFRRSDFLSWIPSGVLFAVAGALVLFIVAAALVAAL